MSGVAAVLDLEGDRPGSDEMPAMLASLRHRALEGEAIWTSGPIALGHARAATTEDDLLTEQPLVKGDLALVWDGRLDNREELSDACGLRASVTSDAGIVLESYRARGDAFCLKLLGDFAFVLWDAQRRRLVAARDVVGIRPLFYSIAGRRVRLASEMSALFATGALARRPNLTSLVALLVEEYDEIGDTFYEGVRSIEPGHMLVVERGSVRTIEFDRISPRASPRRFRFEDHAAELCGALEASVHSRLRARGRISAQLSGGLDSSTVVMLAARELASSGLEAPLLLHWSAPGSGIDERQYASAVASRLGLSLAVTLASEHEEESKRPEPSRQLDDVYFTALNPGLDRIFRRAGEADSRIMLTGFGSDQVMAATGSEWWALARQGQLRHVGRVIGLNQRPILRPRSLVDVARRAFRYLVRPALPAVATTWDRIRLPGPEETWLTRRASRLAASRRTKVRAQARGRAHSDPALTALCERLRGWDIGFVMSHIGRHAALRGIELRYPFLDRRVIDLLLSVPHDQRCHHEVRKPLLRAAMSEVLPPSVLGRTGGPNFITFVYDCTIGAKGDWLPRFMRPSRLVDLGLVDRRRLCKLFADARREQRWRLIREISNIVSLELWIRRSFG
jgi:asparagine synthase (glutamine-hydrolysing)